MSTHPKLYYNHHETPPPLCPTCLPFCQYAPKMLAPFNLTPYFLSQYLFCKRVTRWVWRIVFQAGDIAVRVDKSINSNTHTESTLLKEHTDSSRNLQKSKSKSRSTGNLSRVNFHEDAEPPQEDFVIRRKDDKTLSNRDFSTYTNPKPRRSVSPSRSLARRSASPSRSKSLVKGNATVEALPGNIFVFCMMGPTEWSVYQEWLRCQNSA